jgi:peptidoglycan hydrolase CwlO-like protein
MSETSKQLFHSLFNKINNICVAAGANKKILQEENLEKLSLEELKARIKELIGVLGRIDENARSLDKSLKELYKSVKE